MPDSVLLQNNLVHAGVRVETAGDSFLNGIQTLEICLRATPRSDAIASALGAVRDRAAATAATGASCQAAQSFWWANIVLDSCSHCGARVNAGPVVHPHAALAF